MSHSYIIILQYAQLLLDHTPNYWTANPQRNTFTPIEERYPNDRSNPITEGSHIYTKNANEKQPITQRRQAIEGSHNEQISER